MNYRHVLPGARRALLFGVLQPYFDQIFDFLFQIYGNEEAAIDTLQVILRRATRKFPHERYERYLALWIFRLTVEVTTSRYANFVGEQANPKSVPFSFLTLEEKLAFLLRDRVKLGFPEIAAAMQMPEGKVGRLLAYAREKAGERIVGSEWRAKLNDSPGCEFVNLTARVAWNQTYGTDEARPAGASAAYAAYEQQIAAAVKQVEALQARRFVEIESSIRKARLLPLLREPKSFRWAGLSWKAKVGFEGLALALVGVLALVVFPWFVERIDQDAIREGRYTQIFHFHNSGETEIHVISADRLLASAEEESVADRELSSLDEKDEFAQVDFPSGDFYETGAAPLAPSRQSAAVFRVIVQSSSPRDAIPQIRGVFEKMQVKERDSSGKLMPGGVFFDGITDVGSYPSILKDIEDLKVGKTWHYSNVTQHRNPNERARLIVWVQQI